jgi:hypothetical protein
VESDVRFFRRRANEEFAAASRAVTEAARARRMILGGLFLERLKAVEASCVAAEPGAAAEQAPAFRWENATVEQA